MALSQVTSARDDDVNLANDLVQFDHPESVHAVEHETEEIKQSASARQ